MVSSISFKTQSDTSQNFNKDNIKVKNSLGGTVAGLVLGGMVHNNAPLSVLLPIHYGVQKCNNLPPQEYLILKNAVKQMVQETGLEEKGVRIKFLNPHEKKIKLNNVLMKHRRDMKINTNDPFHKFYIRLIDRKILNPVRRGYNAFFVSKGIRLPKINSSEFIDLANKGKYGVLASKLKDKAYYINPNSIVLPKDKLPTAGFHEVGHAMNYNLSKVGKFLQECKPIAKFAPIVLGVYGAISRRSKPTGENKELTSAQKTNNFIRDNAGKLTLLASLPMLIEEGMATFKGQKFANKVLKPDLAKKVLKGNLLAYSSYLVIALFGALAVRTAVNMKDYFMEKKENKVRQKLEKNSSIEV